MGKVKEMPPHLSHKATEEKRKEVIAVQKEARKH